MSLPAILYVEDNCILAQTVKDVLEMAGWHVEHCSDSCMARALMEHHKHYDLLLLDNELQGFSGLELTRRARELPHLRQTPLSSSLLRIAQAKRAQPERTSFCGNLTT